jgi:hypothetical protein
VCLICRTTTLGQRFFASVAKPEAVKKILREVRPFQIYSWGLLIDGEEVFFLKIYKFVFVALYQILCWLLTIYLVHFGGQDFYSNVASLGAVLL